MCSLTIAFSRTHKERTLVKVKRSLCRCAVSPQPFLAHNSKNVCEDKKGLAHICSLTVTVAHKRKVRSLVKVNRSLCRCTVSP